MEDMPNVLYGIKDHGNKKVQLTETEGGEILYPVSSKMLSAKLADQKYIKDEEGDVFVQTINSEKMKIHMILHSEEVWEVSKEMFPKSFFGRYKSVKS